MGRLFPDRPCPIEAHPVYRRVDYRVPTPAINQFHQLIQRCLRFRIPGAIIYGRPRFGKSSAIDFLQRYLQANGLKLPLLRLDVHAKKIPSEFAFFGNLLAAAGHPSVSARESSQLRRRLAAKLRELAEVAGDDRIVLFTDEAQDLSRLELEWLRDIHNAMARHSILFTALLVGSHELRAKKSILQSERAQQIVARFMREELPFHGLRNASDCATVLKGYDVTAYPQDSDWSYTRFFLPRAWGAGLRLVDQADALWDSFVDAHARARLPGDPEIGMEFFTSAVEYALAESLVADNKTYVFTESLWRAAVDNSGYVRSLDDGDAQIGVA